jgi:ribosomal protein S6
MADMSQAHEASTQATAKDTRLVYEVGFHLMPSIPEDGVGAVVEKVRALLGGAEIISQGYPAKMTLAYTIERAGQGKREKFTQSYFGWIKFAVEDQSGTPALMEGLRAQPQVIRSIVIETVREEAKPAKRAVFGSDRLEGQTIEKAPREAEQKAEVSQEELDKSIEALTG